LIPTSFPALATITRAPSYEIWKIRSSGPLQTSRAYSRSLSATFCGINTISCSRPLLGSCRISLRSWRSLSLSFSTSPIPHTAPGHQFQHEPIPGLGGPENDLVHGLPFDDIPFRGHALPVELADHGRITWIYKAVVQIVADEIEEGTNVGITDAFGVGFVALGESIEKPQNIVGCYLIDFMVTESLAEPIDDRLVRPNRISFRNGPCGNRSRWWPPLRLSWRPPLVKD